jgi:hypothetical protein
MALANHRGLDKPCPKCGHPTYEHAIADDGRYHTRESWARLSPLLRRGGCQLCPCEEQLT